MKESICCIAIVLGCLLHASCSSPLEIDTPRDRIVERMPITSARFLYNDGSTTGALFDEESWEGEIAADAGRIWLRGVWSVPTALRSGIPLMRISLVLDAVPIDGTDIGIINGTAGNSGSVTVNLPPFPDDQEFLPDGSSTTLTLRLTHDSVNRRINGTVASLVPTTRPFSFDGTLEIEY